MTTWKRVCAAADLQPGDRRLVTHEGRTIGIFNVDGSYYAIQNECLHSGGPVCQGKVQGKLVAEFVEPGRWVKERFSDDPVVACPWHGWEYELRTGKHVGDSSVQLDSFDVKVEDDGVFVAVEPR